MTTPSPKKIETTYFGHERQPVIVIDDFLANPNVPIEDAAMLSFGPVGLHYPGVQAAVSPVLVRRFLQEHIDLICETFDVVMSFEDVECYYSLVTRPAEALTPIQRLPHFDSSDPNRIAVLHYLARGEQGGTSFFRHRATQLESVSADMQDSYIAAIDADVGRYGLPNAGYIAGDTAIFERIAHYEALFNRAIIYRGNVLHCADIPPDMPLSADPNTGRLTVNSFINARPVPLAWKAPQSP